MSESRSHMQLVEIALDYIYRIVPLDSHILIQVDSPDTQRPGAIDSFIPDIYYDNKGLIIIGEAKTLDDFDRPHSKLQYRAYLQRLINMASEGIFVVSVPWQLIPNAKNYFRRLKTELNSNATIVVLNELGKEHII